jgi:hypothetical protein
VLALAALAPSGEAQQSPMPALELTVRAEPRAQISRAELSRFALHFVVRNVGTTEIDPQLGNSELLVNGRPWSGWPLTINNGPIDQRWDRLPPRDQLEFGRALSGALFEAGPGRYEIVLRTSGVQSRPLVVTVTP